MGLAFIACTRQDEVLPEQLVKTKEIIITATREKLETKTELQSGSNVYWCPGDSISLFFRNGENGGSKFKAQNTESVPIAEFKGTIDVVSGGGEESGGEFWFWGVYPYSTQNSCDGNTITTVIPHEQVGKAGTFASNTFITMARAKGLNLAFYNICTGVKFNLSRTDIKAVTFRGNKNEHIAGKVNVGWNDSGKPAIQSYVSGRKVITVTAPEGETFASGTDYYIIFAPTLFKEGFTMTVITNDSKQGVFYYNNSREFMRSIFVNISNLNERVNAWADVGDAAVKEVTDEGGTIEVNIDSDVECHALIPEDAQSWISVATKTKSTQQTIGLVVQPNTGESRSATIIIHSVDGTIVLPYVIEQTANHKAELAREREALIALYTSTNGDEWHDLYGVGKNVRFNWCSSNEVSSWFGVSCNANGNVVELNLAGASLNGYLPDELSNLKELKKIYLQNNEIKGNIPESFSKLKNLEVLVLQDNKLKGVIPAFLGSLTHLKQLALHENYFTGSIPESLINLKELTDLRLSNNLLSGKIPYSFYDWDFWKSWWGLSLLGNLYDFNTIELPGPKFSVSTIDEQQLNSNDIYANHQYTILFQWCTADAPALDRFIQELQEINAKYGEKIMILSWANSNLDKKEDAILCYNQLKIPGKFFYWDYSDYNFTEDVSHLHNTFGTVPWYPANYVSSMTVVDKNGRIVLSDLFNIALRPINCMGNHELTKWLEDTTNSHDDRYASSDYSQDGKLTVLQQSTVNNGPNLIIIGDGFSDRQQDLFDSFANKACSAFFSEEPYNSYKDLFNVYTIHTVSKNEGYEEGNETALSCYFGSGTYVGGSDQKCIMYAVNAGINSDGFDQTTIIVLVNRDYYCGTCYMYGSWYGSYGDGLSIAYCPTVSDIYTFNGTISHEAGGHGFAKLADEYAYEYMGAISAEDITISKSREPYGWWKNIDFTNDPTQVKWSSFISDNRYANEHIGCYEGGLTYWTGVWRPTENSIMRYNVGGFNAPSRYAIWYRIGKLAYGSNWNGTYEDFVTYDAVNISSAAIASNAAQVRKLKKPLPPLHAPVVRGYNWRDMKKMEQKKDERNKK